MNLVEPHADKATAPLFPVNPMCIRVGSCELSESLGSWLHRFGQSNGHCDLQSLLGKYPSLLNSPSGLDASLNFEAHSELISQTTWLSSTTVRQLMLGDTLNVLDGSQTWNVSRWLLRPIKKQHPGTRLRHAICPICVVNFPDPFWLKSWRFVTATQCHVHKVLLLDFCPACKGDFVIHRSRNHPLDHCETCHLHFSQMPTVALRSDRHAPSFCRNVGKNAPKSLPVAQPSELHWWIGVRKLLTLIGDPHTAREFARGPIPEEFSQFLQESGTAPKLPFHDWPTSHRHQGFRFIEWLATDWPNRLDSLDMAVGSAIRNRSCMKNPEVKWIREGVDQVSLRTLQKRYPAKYIERSLHAEPVARLYLSLDKKTQRICSRKRKGPSNQTWSPEHSARIVQMFNTHLLNLKGTLDQRAAILQGALDKLRIHGASILSGTNPPNTPIAASIVHSMEVMAFWNLSLENLRNRVHASARSSIQISTIKPNRRRIAHWLSSNSTDPQLLLFGW